MIRWLNTPLSFLALLAALSVLALATPSEASACETTDSYGVPRDCTYTEKHGECYWNAEDSYNQCRDKAGTSGWKRFKCDAALFVDDLACSISSPFKSLFQVSFK